MQYPAHGEDGYATDGSRLSRVCRCARVLPSPKRLRIFLRVIAQSLQPRWFECGQGGPTHRRGSFYPPLWSSRALVGRGLLQSSDDKEMLAYQHSGFSVDAGACIKAHDRAALERLLRYCAHPPLTMERLRKDGVELVYRCAKVDKLQLISLELINRIAAQAPGALPVGRTDGPHLLCVPALAHDVRRPDASGCVHHAQCRHQANTELHRGGVRVTAHNPARGLPLSKRL